MNQAVAERFWQAEARTEETKRLIHDVKRITRRKCTAEEKLRIVLEGFRRDALIHDFGQSGLPANQPIAHQARLPMAPEIEPAYPTNQWLESAQQYCAH